MPFTRPPPDDRTTMPILTVSFLLHTEKNAIRTETVRCVGFNEFLQYTSFHKLLLISYLYYYFFLIAHNRPLNSLFFFKTSNKLAP